MRTLYRYVGHRLEKHKLTEECFPREEEFDTFGKLYRCRTGGANRHDHYGYLKMKEAKAEEIEVTKAAIHSLKNHLVMLGGTE